MRMLEECRRTAGPRPHTEGKKKLSLDEESGTGYLAGPSFESAGLVCLTTNFLHFLSVQVP